MKSHSFGLFDRLPDNIFSLLHGKNGRRAWLLLERLATQYFGLDSDPPYPDGYLHGDITKEIERFLLDEGWEEEEGEQLSQSINIQANYLLTRLVTTGWLIEDKVGARNFITMRPVISRFFELLHQFATDGPPMIGGNIQLVHAQMKSVIQDPRGQAAGFVTAAKLCTQLISSLNSTAFRVRDLMQELTKEKEIRIFVERFFAEHISEIYIRDFKELRTENHPLRHRMDILLLVDQVSRTEPFRSELLQGYRELPGLKNENVEELLERDIERFHRLMSIERFLERMDRIIDVVYQRANAYLSYRLKATERLETAILDAIQVTIKTDERQLPIEGNFLAPDPVINQDHLYQAQQKRPKPNPLAVRKRVMTPAERAMHFLRKAMIANRDTSAEAMRGYVMETLMPGEQLSVTDLPSDSVQDAVAQVALLHIATIAQLDSHKFKTDPLLKHLGFTIEQGPGDRVDTEFFDLPNFVIRREGAENAT